MADLKISQLTAGNPAQNADLIPIARNVSGTETNFSVSAGSIAASGNNVYFTTSYGGADLCTRIQQALTAAGNVSATIDARGEVGTQTCNVNWAANLSGSAGVVLLLPPYPITMNTASSAWVVAANDVRIIGMGVTGVTTRLNAGGSFPASTPMVTLGASGTQYSNLRVENLSINCTSGPSTCTCLTAYNLQEFSGIYQVNLLGANSASTTAAVATFTDPAGGGHYTVQDVSCGAAGANDCIAVTQKATTGAWFNRITLNNTGKVQGLSGIHCTSISSANTIAYFHGIHAEGFNNTIEFGSHTGGAADNIDSTGVNTDVLHIDAGALTVTAEHIYGAGTNVVNDLSNTPNTVLTVANNPNGLSYYSNAPSIAPSTYTVSTLPAASSVALGTMVVVTDATTFTPGSCIGGGSDVMIAVAGSSSWSCH